MPIAWGRLDPNHMWGGGGCMQQQQFDTLQALSACQGLPSALDQATYEVAGGHCNAFIVIAQSSLSCMLYTGHIDHIQLSSANSVIWQ